MYEIIIFSLYLVIFMICNCCLEEILFTATNAFITYPYLRVPILNYHYLAFFILCVRRIVCNNCSLYVINSFNTSRTKFIYIFKMWTFVLFFQKLVIFVKFLLYFNLFVYFLQWKNKFIFYRHILLDLAFSFLKSIVNVRM